jgi:hypothetical protein
MAQFFSQCRARGWSETKANEVLTEFVDKTRERVQFGFGIAVDGKYFRRKFEIAEKSKDPKRFYVQRLLRRMREELIVPGYPLHLAITFDDDEEFSIECYRIITRLRRDHPDLRELVTAIQFADDKIHTPLQAADIVAHLTREHLITGQTPPLLERLASPNSGFELHFDGGELWDEGEIDKSWSLIESSQDMPAAWTYPHALKPQANHKVVLPSGKEVEIAKATPVFSRWTGAMPSDTFGGKPVLELNGEMVFAELAICASLSRPDGKVDGLIATEIDFGPSIGRSLKAKSCLPRKRRFSI